MKISGRNKLQGSVKAVQIDGLMAKVTIDVGGQTLTSVITSEAVQDLALREGDRVQALVKATSVMLVK